MRSLGVSEATITIERDGWTLLMALAPGQVPEWADHKRAALGDPEFRLVYLAWEEANHWDPDDPRVADLAARTAAWLATRPPGLPPAPADAGISAVSSLLSAQLETASPAWRRLDKLLRDRLPSSGPPSGAGQPIGPTGRGRPSPATS